MERATGARSPPATMATVSSEIISPACAATMVVPSSSPLPSRTCSLTKPAVSSVETLRSFMPDYANPRNPLDGTGAMHEDPWLFPQLFDVLLRDDRYGVSWRTRTLAIH